MFCDLFLYINSSKLKLTVYVRKCKKLTSTESPATKPYVLFRIYIISTPSFPLPSFHATFPLSATSSLLPSSLSAAGSWMNHRVEERGARIEGSREDSGVRGKKRGREEREGRDEGGREIVGE